MAKPQGAFKIVAFVMLRHEASLSAMLEMLRASALTMEKKRAKNKSDNFKCTQTTVWVYIKTQQHLWYCCVKYD